MLVICAGMLRSGSTLQYNLVAGLIEALKAGSLEGYFTGQDMRVNADRLRGWRDARELHAVSTHEIPDDCFFLLNDERVCILHTRRDLLDVAQSAKATFRISGTRLVEVIGRAVMLYGRLQKANNVLLQDYTALTNDKKAALSEIAGFLGLVATGETLDHVINGLGHRNGSTIQRLIDEILLGIRERAYRVNGRIKGGLLLRHLGFSPFLLFRLRRLIMPHHPKTLWRRWHITPQSVKDNARLTSEEEEMVQTCFPDWCSALGNSRHDIFSERSEMQNSGIGDDSM